MNVFTIYCVVLIGACATAKNTLSPVILVPGDGGSQIDGKWDKNITPNFFCSKTQESWYNLWLNVEEFVPFAIDCWTDNIKLVYDNNSRTSSPPAGVQTKVNDFGTPHSVEYLSPSGFTSFTSYFYYIAESIINLGYVRNTTIRGAPYDFRKAPNELQDYFVQLKQLVEETYQIGDQQKITFVSHSMGGPVLHYFLINQTQQWKDKYVQAIISLSAPWAGSVKALRVFAAGYNLDYWVLPILTLRSVQRTEPSLAFLMPSLNEWNKDEILASSPLKNYSLSNINDFFIDIGFPDGYEMYKDTKDLLYKAPPPGVEVHCLYGVDRPTTDKITYPSMKKFPNSPTLVTGDGDGTVGIRSSTYCEKWRSKQKQKIISKPIPGVDHMHMLVSDDVIEYIYTYLKSVRDQNESKMKNHVNSIWWLLSKIWRN